jgi:WD40 repeat protein/DNA polymerase III delta prime subunit
MTADEALEQIARLLEPRPLNKIQRLILQHAWEGLSYGEIAQRVDYDLGYVRDTGSKLWKLLSEAIGEKVTKQNLSAILPYYFRQHSPAVPTLHPRQDWGEAVDTSVFYGREEELARLQQWIVSDRCRLLTILGLGGVGKTSIAAKLARQLGGEFDYIIWRSLQSAPQLEELLTALLQFLSKDNTALEGTANQQLSRLQQYLHNSRCLIVLDNFDALFTPTQQGGTYRQGYENYQPLMRSLAEIPHQSCLMITSREPIAEIRELQGQHLAVREWRLRGLEPRAARQLLAVKGIEGTADDLDRLINSYQGNPLALKIAASSIQSLFLGRLKDFLEQGIIAWGEIRQLLATQIARLSAPEQQAIYWLAIARESTSAKELQSDIFPPLSLSVILEALASLQGRSLIEVTSEGFTLQPVVMEYLTEQLTSRVKAELYQLAEPSFFHRYALLKATAKDYIRDSQTRLVIEPIIQEAIAYLGSHQALSDRLKEWLDHFKKGDSRGRGYAIGNLINLLIHLEVDLTGFDFSNLPIWQAYLAQVRLHQVNFAAADLRDCVFAETFGGISDVAFSPDGKLLATSDTAGEVQVWQVANGQQLLAFQADLAWTWAVVFSPDGQLLATAGDDYVVKLWEVRSGTCLQQLRGHTNTINDLAFHPQGNLLASCALDRTIRLWQIDPLQTEPGSIVLSGHSQRVWSVAFSADGSQLVSGSEDKTLQLWKVRTGEREGILKGYSAWVKTVAFSPDGQAIASGGFDGTIEMREKGDRYQWQGHGATVTRVIFSPDGRLLASASYDQTVKLWDVRSRQCIKTFTGHSNRVWSIAFSPDGQFLASGGDDNTTRLWHLQTGRCAKAWKGHSNIIFSLAIDRRQKLLATGHEDQTVKLWDAKTGEQTKVFYGHENRVLGVAFAPNRPILASASADRSIKLWHLETGECWQSLEGHRSWVWSIAFHPEGHQLASGSYDQTIKLWDLESGQCLKTLEGHTASVKTVLFSPDGQHLFSCSFDTTIKIWDSLTGDCLGTLTGHQNTVWMLVMSPDGRFLASASYDRTVKLWEVRSRQCLKTLMGHTAPVSAVIFSNDGKQLMSGSVDRSIKIWDLNTENCLRTLTGHQGMISNLIFAQETSISSSFDETLRFWNPQTGECTQTRRALRPYEALNITGIKGVSEFQKARLKALGARED